MKCPHCNTALYTMRFLRGWTFKDPEQTDAFQVCQIVFDNCPVCKKAILLLRRGTGRPTGDYYGRPSYELRSVEREELLFPRYSQAIIQSEVPNSYRQEFVESSAVLSISPKASAALSRRLLQSLLREEYGIKSKSLAQEIAIFVQHHNLPSDLAESMEAIREIGNFAAHPSKDINTGAIIEVEPGEAEWLLETIKDLLDFTFVRPKRLEQRRKKLDEKRKSMGKTMPKN